MIVEFLEITFSRHDTCKLLCDTSLALARSSPTRRYTGVFYACRRVEHYDTYRIDVSNYLNPIVISETYSGLMM